MVWVALGKKDPGGRKASLDQYGQPTAYDLHRLCAGRSLLHMHRARPYTLKCCASRASQEVMYVRQTPVLNSCNKGKGPYSSTVVTILWKCFKYPSAASSINFRLDTHLCKLRDTPVAHFHTKTQIRHQRELTSGPASVARKSPAGPPGGLLEGPRRAAGGEKIGIYDTYARILYARKPRNEKSPIAI